MNEHGLEGASRRRFLAVCSAMGLGGTLFPGVMLGMVEQARGAAAGANGAGTATGEEKAFGLISHEAKVPITVEMIEKAAAIAGLTFSAEERAAMLDGVRERRDSVFALRSMNLANAVAPAVIFDPRPAGIKLERVAAAGPMRMSAAPKLEVRAGGEDELAFRTVRELAELLRTRKVTSVALTTMYLGRLKKCAPQLHFLITPTDERAMASAAAADRRIAAGNYLGPLDGVPWGAKDLLAVEGYPTTWGAAGFEAQHFDYDAEVVTRLDKAGAVLVAKLSMGALAQGIFGLEGGRGTRGIRGRDRAGRARGVRAR